MNLFEAINPNPKADSDNIQPKVEININKPSIEQTSTNKLSTQISNSYTVSTPNILNTNIINSLTNETINNYLTNNNEYYNNETSCLINEIIVHQKLLQDLKQKAIQNNVLILRLSDIISFFKRANNM